jgi:peptide/nickel transport system permease protein
VTAIGIELAPAPSLLRRRRIGLRPVVVLSIAWIAFVLLVALTVQWLPLRDYVIGVGEANQPPGLRREFLGTDATGRSMVSRLAYGARISILISLASTAIGMAVGGLLGLLSVYLRGVVAAVIDVAVNSLLAIPNLVMMLAIVLVLDPTTPVLILGLSIGTVPMFARMTRTNALEQLGRDYVLAARIMGVTGQRMLFNELLPNTVPSVLSYAVLIAPAVIISEGSLSFLGFGVQPPYPSWGGQIAQGRIELVDHPWPAVIPCLVLFLTVFALNKIGDELRRRVA